MKYLQLNTIAIISKRIRLASLLLIQMKANPKYYIMMPKKQKQVHQILSREYHGNRSKDVTKVRATCVGM